MILPGAACVRSSSCRDEQVRVYRLPVPEARQSPCWKCKDRLVRVKRTARCADCGKTITRYASTCKPCRGKRRTALMPKTCTHPGCRWKARRGGLCASHYWKGRPAPYARHKEARA